MGDIRRRKTFTIQEKMSILAQVDSNTGTRASLAEKLGIRRSTLNGIVKNREDTERYYAQCGEKFSSKRKSTKQSPMEELEILLSNWFKQCKANHTPVTGKELKEKARQLATEYGLENFKASNGWIDRFKQRFNVVYKSIVPAPDAANIKDTEDWKNVSLSYLTHEYYSRNVYNVVEIGLYYKLHPGLTTTVTGDPCNLGEKAQERLTVLLATNADGSDKLAPLVIGKCSIPADSKNLPTLYFQNNKAWITPKIFEEFLKAWDMKLRMENRKILLFLDSNSAHSSDVSFLTNIRVNFFPSNSTSQVHPFDQNIIFTFKHNYRKLLLRKTVFTNRLFIPEIQVALADALNYVADAWRLIDHRFIKTAFDKCGFKFDCFLDENLNGYKQEVFGMSDEEWQRVKPEGVSFLDYVSCDDYLEICESDTGEELEPIKQEIKSDTEDNEEDSMEVEVPSFQSVIAAIEHIRKYHLSWGNDTTLFAKLNEVENELYKINDLNSLAFLNNLEKQ